MKTTKMRRENENENTTLKQNKDNNEVFTVRVQIYRQFGSNWR
jgi:hypothetical protein